MQGRYTCAEATVLSSSFPERTPSCCNTPLDGQFSRMILTLRSTTAYHLEERAKLLLVWSFTELRKRNLFMIQMWRFTEGKLVISRNLQFSESPKWIKKVFFIFERILRESSPISSLRFLPSLKREAESIKETAWRCSRKTDKRNM